MLLHTAKKPRGGRTCRPSCWGARSRGPFTSHVCTELPGTRSHLSQGGRHATTDQSQRMKTWPSLPKSGHLWRATPAPQLPEVSDKIQVWFSFFPYLLLTPPFYRVGPKEPCLIEILPANPHLRVCCLTDPTCNRNNLHSLRKPTWRKKWQSDFMRTIEKSKWEVCESTSVVQNYHWRRGFLYFS